MARSTSRLSETERAERRRQDRERLQRAAEQLLTLEGWQRWVRVRSQAGLARLSLSNQLLVALARADATFVAGFKGWLRLGFAVKEGERAIAIVAPLPLAPSPLRDENPSAAGLTPARLGAVEPVRERGAGGCGTVDCCHERESQTHLWEAPLGGTYRPFAKEYAGPS
jgi:hypothetical protein